MKRIVNVIGVITLSLFTLQAYAFGPQSKIKIHREGDKVWLEGVKVLPMGERESSVQGAQASIMQALGEKVDYDYLVGVSGLAFRMQVSKDGLCPSSPNPYCGFICAARSIEALPWKTESIDPDYTKPGAGENIKRKIVASIDKGMPVKYGWEEDGLIVGYQKNGDELLCLHPTTDVKKPFVNKDQARGLNFYTERKTSLRSRKEMAIESLKQAIRMSRMPEAEGYWCGLKAWEVYMQKVESLDSADEKSVSESMTGNAWIYECIASYRRSAARYLRMIVSDMPLQTTGHLMAAASLYDNMANQVLADKSNCVINVAPYPWSLKTGEKWTADSRAKQLDRLRKAFELEKRAIIEISRTLEDLPLK